MVFEDDEIERSRVQDQAGAGRTQREATANARTIKLFAKKMKEAKLLKDRDGFERLLELQNVKRKTAEWDALWRYFYSAEI